MPVVRPKALHLSSGGNLGLSSKNLPVVGYSRALQCLTSLQDVFPLDHRPVCISEGLREPYHCLKKKKNEDMFIEMPT